ALTGKVRRVNASAIQQHLDKNNIVLISNLGYSPTGEVFNLSQEEVATETAIAMQAEKLIMFVPEKGIMDEQGKLLSTLKPRLAQSILDRLAAQKDHDNELIIDALAVAIKACRKHVHRTHLISYKINGALIEELFTRDGSGTLISKDIFEELRSAS